MGAYGDSSARQALTAAFGGRRPGGPLLFLPAVGKEDQGCSRQPVGTGTWVLGSKVPLYGEVCTRTLSAEVVDLAWGVARVRGLPHRVF